ncbi:MAG TPA: endonuclease III domain-containing protein [Verrucomicrobiae bacterium]|nr:endonuclease III domain-containing protein [Verrucomicrobiae bacterium]
MTKTDRPSAVTARHRHALRRAYELMRARFGHQHWWPGETPFEVCVGAILTQNTAWTNVERAMANLKAAHVLEPARLFALSESRLADLIRPAGYFNVKARRLRSFLRVLVEDFGGDLKRLFAGETATVRARLLAINGVGPETADSMLLYAGGHHSFVIDAYTRRIFQRHNWSSKPARLRSATARPAVQSSKSLDSYDDLKSFCEAGLNQKTGAAQLDHWQDYHAQLVMVGKHFCRTRAPRCEQCPLKPLLP